MRSAREDLARTSARRAALLLVLLLSGCPTKQASPQPRSEPQDAGAPDPFDEADRRFAEALTGHRSARYTGDLGEVKRRGVLRVLTRNNSTGYFLYKGVETGFDYELARRLAQELGLRLEVVVPRARRDLIPWLLEGRGDIVIGGVSVNAPRGDRVRFTRPYLSTPWVVVARAERAGRIAAVADLAGMTVLVRPSSAAMKRMRALSKEVPGGIDLKAVVESLESEDLLDLVSAGEAGAAVVERRVVDMELLHRDDVAVAFELPGGEEQAAWAVRPEDRALLEAADQFIKRHYRGTEWNVLYKRFFENRARAKAVQNQELRADRRGRLSPWDDAFKAAARDHGLDWRLLVAQAYQESRFDPAARSPMGALGLMQILPSTAAEIGLADPLDPVQAVHGGARLMAKLMKRYESPEIALKDRVRFALAAYNVGPGHVADARKLAARRDLDPNRWFGHVEQAMLLLAKPRFYQEATYGYCRGEEAVRYVSEIQTRYDAYVALTVAAAD